MRTYYTDRRGEILAADLHSHCAVQAQDKSLIVLEANERLLKISALQHRRYDTVVLKTSTALIRITRSPDPHLNQDLSPNYSPETADVQNGYKIATRQTRQGHAIDKTVGKHRQQRKDRTRAIVGMNRGIPRIGFD